VAPVEAVYFSLFASIFAVSEPKMFMDSAIGIRIHGNGLVILLKKIQPQTKNSKLGNTTPNSSLFTLKKKPFHVAN
jgi:hypothetical protein